MKNRKIRLEDMTIILPLDNSIQTSQLIEYKESIMLFLRQKLQNYTVNLDARVEKQQNAELLYTSQQKFDHLLKENPILKELKERLGLEIDF